MEEAGSPLPEPMWSCKAVRVQHMIEGKKMDGEHTQKALMEITMKNTFGGGEKSQKYFCGQLGSAEDSRKLCRKRALCFSLCAKSCYDFKLLMRESFSTSIVMSPWCDNTAAIAMMEEPGWRTRCISIYGEAARQEVLNRTMIHVSTDHQLADPLTKPTTAAINALIFPQWGLIRYASR